jgi:hypothetical protein
MNMVLSTAELFEVNAFDFAAVFFDDFIQPTSNLRADQRLIISAVYLTLSSSTWPGDGA